MSRLKYGRDSGNGGGGRGDAVGSPAASSVCFGYVGGGGVGLRWLLGYVMKAEAIVVVVVVVVVRWRHWANDHGSNCSIRYYRSSWHKRR